MSNTDPTCAQAGFIGAHISWANTKDRSARTAPGRAALEQKFLDEADGDAVRAAHLRKAYYARLAMKSAQSRREKRDLRNAIGVLDPTGETAAHNVDQEHQ